MGWKMPIPVPAPGGVSTPTTWRFLEGLGALIALALLLWGISSYIGREAERKERELEEELKEEEERGGLY
ncbi:hypothetical protein [Thermococcus sp.]|uniref:hypothetical protein n=1 Tax=Thermococcus sp. TaxID=35749 RepID=UPI00262C1196|nr:hypothetical protein [Thermococcus sp.]